MNLPAEFKMGPPACQTILVPVAAYGPFVMNSKTESTQAIEDYHNGRLGRLAA